MNQSIRRLVEYEEKKLFNLVDQGPEASGFDCGVWNAAMINEVIFREFGVMYNPHYLCTLLKKIGLSYQNDFLFF